MVSIVTSIGDLRKKSISYLTIGEISVEGNDLVFYLDNWETERITLPEPPVLSNIIYFNRNGISSGGEIIIDVGQKYNIIVAEVTGKISLQKL